MDETDNINMDKSRPNIRIQIHNNLNDSSKMETDQEENEEGEIVDDGEIPENSDLQKLQNLGNDNDLALKDVFTTGINIFDKQEQQKLQERARRFALKPEEINNFTDSDLSELYESLGITSDSDRNIRFEAVHILGTHGMSVEDLLEYFANYAPKEIEFVDNNSYNVVWVDNISAARAIFYNSKAVNGMPAREPVDTFAREFLDDVEEEPSGKSILLKNREVELTVDELLTHNKPSLKNAVDISEIKTAIPPGYWRLGKSHCKAKYLLLRYALRTDKQPYKIEDLRKYYKKLGTKLSISDEKWKEPKGVFERNKDLKNGKNPWGPIAKNWDIDAKFREPEREPEIIIETVNSNLQSRLGKKQTVEDDAKSHSGDDINEQKVEVVTKAKGKMPRMRMYADEEEEKVRRKRLLQKLKNHTENHIVRPTLDNTDLRNVLGLSNKVSDEVIEIESESDETDLGSRLKSRTRNMVFTVRRDVEKRSKENSRRISLSPYRRPVSPIRYSVERKFYRKRSRSPITRYKSPVRKRSVHDKYAYHRKSRGTLHSDRIMSRHKRRRRESDSSVDSFEEHKPKSRVAVVVKKPKKPTVASTVWSRVRYESDSESSSRSGSSESEESSSYSSRTSSGESETESESESDSESNRSTSSSYTRRKVRVKRVIRPGFQGSTLFKKVSYNTPLKVTMSNDKIRR